MFIDHRYKVLESLGTGSWANVYKVQDVRTGNIYTLKLFQYLSSETLYKYFKAKDMHHITKIGHPNLNQVVDFGHVGDHIYYISDYFDGSTLVNFRYTKNKVNSLYAIIVQICYALNALHTQNIIHKDIKPENILYKTTGKTLEVKLIDYGFSRLDLDKDTQFVSGTLPYIAPEVYQGKPAVNASDFYALGVMIYKIVTGSFPFNLEQINALRSGSQQYFIPIFPSEMNPNVPLHLEKLCLRLLERNPESRFQSSEEIIKYINRAIGSEFPFSVSWSLVNSLQFNSYLVRDDINDELLGHLQQVEAGNGKIISLIGGEGLGKDNALSLFRYHILRGTYFIFDYACTRTDHEAFFALIKEYLLSLPEDEVRKYNSRKLMSEKLYQYLFTSEQAAKGFTQSHQDLAVDFSFAKTLLLELSEQKPMVFIIRDIQHVHKHTIDFINYISPHIVDHKIMVVLSCTDFNKIRQIEHTILLSVPLFKPEETSAYVKKLFNHNMIPDDFCRLIHERTSGNPYFTREILIDLILRKKIYIDGEFHYPEDLDDYSLPSRLVHSVYSRMSHLTSDSYKQLQKLAIVQTPISLDLIRKICKIKDAELYQMLTEGKYNEILDRQGNNYCFTFPEAKNRFFNECPLKLQQLVSMRNLKYHQGKQYGDAAVYHGLIKNAQIAQDKTTERHYWLELHHLERDDTHHEEAYHAITEAIKLDLGEKGLCSQDELLSDLSLFMWQTEITGLLSGAAIVWANQRTLPDDYVTHRLLGVLKTVAEDQNNAKRYFVKAQKHAHTADQIARSLLDLAQLTIPINPQKAQEYLVGINPEETGNTLQIDFVIASANILFLSKEPDRAIALAEDFLSRLTPSQDPDVLYHLALLHNDLGEFYSALRNVVEADEHFNHALNILTRYNIKRYLSLVHNNISDLSLKQGYTVTAAKHSAKALIHAKDLNQTLAQAKALLGQGETKIKMGEFLEAEKQLQSAKLLLDNIQTKRYLDTIQSNLALAKSKVVGFGHYYRFILEAEPKLVNDYIPTLNPLVKTYIYYLSEMKAPQKLRKLLRKNAHIDFQYDRELEFYHNLLSLLAIAENDYSTALQELKLAMQFAGEINNHYALAVFNVLQIVCLYGMQEYVKASELLESAKPGIVENQYNYWLCYLDMMEIKLDLMVPSIPLRSILRKVNRSLAVCERNDYYQVILELRQAKIQILLELFADSSAQREYEEYCLFLDRITESINEVDKAHFLSANQYGLTGVRSFNMVRFVSRRKDSRRKWNDLLFNIANVNSVQRVKFLIEKGITQVVSPWQFKLMVFSDKISNFYSFMCFNCDSETLIPPEFTPHIEKSFMTDTISQFQYHDKNILIAPLLSGNKRIGYLILGDDGELEFTQSELAIVREIKSHLTALIVRTWDYMEITLRMTKMKQLMHISHDLIRLLDLNTLEQEIVSTAIDFTECTRGFFIKRDDDGNNLYQVQMDQKKQLLSTSAGISKTAIGICQTSQQHLIAFNAGLDERFKNSISVQDYAIQTIFCSPILVDDTVAGYLYLDNFGDSTREMYLNEDLMILLLDQFSIALKNSRQYEALIQKSTEIVAFEQVKDEFMAIVSHELNTPLTSLQGYISRLKRNLYADEEEKAEIMTKLESSVNRLTTSINDISTMNTYNITRSLVMAPVKISEIIDLAYHEVTIVSRKRHLQIKFEVEDNLPDIKANWEALHRMLYNVVLNAVRFTDDFGTIIIGARRSAFPQEKVNNRETLVMYVKDNGIGIPAFRLKDVFRKFYELNEIYAHKSGTIEYRSSGLGLGLAISKRIAELHGGEIVIKSKENEGTTVFMMIPFK